MAKPSPMLHLNSFNQENVVKVIATTLAICLLALCQTSSAQTTTKKPVPKAAASATNVDDDDGAPVTSGSTTHDYRCEANDALTIYTNNDDDSHLALRWKNHIYRMHRVTTSTGANRFENTRTGLVWIGIPSKGMLLDAHHGQQLANECKTAGQ